MKVVLLKSMRVDGVPFAPNAVIDIDDVEFITLEDRGVVRAAQKVDLAFDVPESEPEPEPEPEPAIKQPRKKAAKPDVDEDL